MNPGKTLTVILAAMMVLVVVPFASDGSDAAVSGDGSEDNPYSGTVTELERFAFYRMGTSFNAYVGTDMYVMTGFGLSVTDGYLTGTLEAAGTCIMVNGDVDDDTYYINVAMNDSDSPKAGLLTDLLGISGNDVRISGILISSNYGSYLISGSEYTEGDMYVTVIGQEYPWLYEYAVAIDALTNRYGEFESWDPGVYIGDDDYDPQANELTIYCPESSWELYFELNGYNMFVPTKFVSENRVIWQIVEYQELYDEGYVTIPTPTREGYTFTGWYEDEACTVPWTMLTDNYWSNTDVEADYPYLSRFLYAGWQPDTVTLEFLSTPEVGAGGGDR